MKKVLGIFTAIMVIVFVLSVCSLDSDSYVPYFTALGSLIWIGSYGVCITRD